MAIQFTERFVPPTATVVRWDELAQFNTPNEILSMIKVLIASSLQVRRKYWGAMDEEKRQDWTEDFVDLINREEMALNQKQSEETEL